MLIRCLVVLGLALVVLAPTPAQVTVQARNITDSQVAAPVPAPLTGLRSANDVENAYLRRLNAALKNGNFGPLLALYAPDATLTSSRGVSVTFHGLRVIDNWYRHWRAANPGYYWTQDTTQVLAPTIVLSYLHVARPRRAVAKRYVHLFTLRNAKILHEYLVLY